MEYDIKLFPAPLDTVMWLLNGTIKPHDNAFGVTDWIGMNPDQLLQGSL